MSSYTYTFHYQNGRRAITGDFSCGSDNNALKMGVDLAIKKKKTIVVRDHTYGWYNDSSKIVGWAYPNGEYESVSMIGHRFKSR